MGKEFYYRMEFTKKGTLKMKSFNMEYVQLLMKLNMGILKMVIKLSKGKKRLMNSFAKASLKMGSLTEVK